MHFVHCTVAARPFFLLLLHLFFLQLILSLPSFQTFPLSQAEISEFCTPVLLALNWIPYAFPFTYILTYSSLFTRYSLDLSHFYPRIVVPSVFHFVQILNIFL